MEERRNLDCAGRGVAAAGSPGKGKLIRHCSLETKCMGASGPFSVGGNYVCHP